MAEVTRAELDEIASRFWSEWANGNEGMGPPMVRALERAVELAGGQVVNQQSTEAPALGPAA